MKIIMKTLQQDTKKVFRELGTCSRTFFYLLNREFGHPTEEAERAADPFAGGIMQHGHQCGMLWGATLAVGAEAYRRYGNGNQAIGQAVKATQNLVSSFANRTGTVNCREITKTDFFNKWQMMKYMFFRARACFKLAEKWAPEAVEAAVEGLAQEQSELPEHAMSCASEMAKKMGATEEESVIVAGLAGGLGLSGQGCGALGAAMWMRSLEWSRANPGESAFFNPEAKKILEAFRDATDSEMLCYKICGQRFETIDEHTQYIKSGGCEKLINRLAQAPPTPAPLH